MRGLLAAALAVSMLVTGCVSFVPDYQRPEAPVAAGFAGADAQSALAGQRPASDIHWHEFFGDERLRRLIGIALANNRDLRSAVLGIERARAQYGVVRADLFPTVGIGANRTRQPSPSGVTADVYSAGFVLSSYELDFFGRVRSLSEAALSLFLGSEEARKTVQISLVAAVANAYLNLLADDELLAVTREALATREESTRLTRLMYDSGVVSELDVHQAESLLEGARAAVALLNRQRAVDENALVLLLGQPIPPDMPPGGTLADRYVLADLPAGLPSEVLTRRPDVREAELQLIAANANIGAARAAFFPRISLTATAGIASTELSGLFEGGSGAWTFAAQLLQPLFDAGRNQANLEIAEADRAIAVARYEQAIQIGFREVSDALAGRSTLDEQLRAEEAVVRADDARFRLADLRYRSGTASYLEVLDAQRALLISQQAVVRTRATLAQNQVGLYRALGGGWSEAEAPIAASNVPAAQAAASKRAASKPAASKHPVSKVPASKAATPNAVAAKAEKLRP